MTVKELITQLRVFDQDAMVYVPSNTDGKNDTVRFVSTMPHINLTVPGISVAPDVALLPGDMERYVVAPDDPIEDRMGDD